MGLVCEALGINAPRLLLNTRYVRSCDSEDDDEKRIKRLIEILSEGINRKSNNPSTMLLRAESKRFPL